MLFQNIEFHNVREILALNSGMGYRLCRVPDGVCEELNSYAQSTAFNTPGCELRFNLEGESAEVTLQRAPGGEVPPVGVGEVWYGSFQGPWQECPFSVAQTPSVVRVKRPAELHTLQQITRQQGLPFDPSLVRILLPYDWATWFVDVRGEVSPPRPEQTPARRLLTYGSSITHGGSAIHPSQTYAMQTAAALGMDLVNLGFAGSAHMDAPLAEFIAEQVDWDVATLEMGINVLGWSLEQFEARVNAFVERIALAHPDRWIFCIDVFSYLDDLRGNPHAEAFRQVVRSAVARLNLPRLIHLEGRSLLAGGVTLSTDLVHPSAQGMNSLATHLTASMRQYMG